MPLFPLKITQESSNILQASSVTPASKPLSKHTEKLSKQVIILTLTYIRVFSVNNHVTANEYVFLNLILYKFPFQRFKAVNTQVGEINHILKIKSRLNLKRSEDS